MKRILLISLAFVCFLAFGAQAQRTVSGKVTSAEDGSSIPGVNVILKGTATGATTDLDGSYRINVPADGGTLVFSFVGMETQEVEIGARSVVDVPLRADVTQLTEVVVTAMNISRDKASLGYATQTLDDASVNTAKEQNFVNSLSGKVSGVQIRTNNNLGGSTNIIIRGNNSITGNNQPLFVVDGVPIDNRTGNNSYQENGRYGYDYGSSISDVNPEDIESINVLKGAAATALYGSRASNGVIVITTKKGKRNQGIGVSVSTGVTIGKINRKTFVEYQDEYGAGYGPYYGENDPYMTDYIDVDPLFGRAANGNDLIVPTTEDGSYGGKFSDYEGQPVYHWDSFVPESENYGRAYPYTAAENTPVEFFETSMVYNNSVALSGGNDRNAFRLSYTNYNMKGILPNSELGRNTISFSGSSEINSKLSASLNLNYVTNSATGRYSTGYSDNLMSQFRQWWQVNVDVKQLEHLYKTTGRNVTWNAADFADANTPIFWDNPYWTRFENYQTDERSRTYGNLTLTYKILEGLTLLGRASLDTYSELREERRAIGSIPSEFGIIFPFGRIDESSGYQREDRFVTEANYDLMLSGEKKFTDDFSFYGLLGTNIRDQKFESVTNATLGGLVVPNLYTLGNTVLQNPFPVESLQEKEVYGFFANVNLGFKDMLYLDLTDRVDISSALPIENNTYNYYSAAVSFVFTEAFQIPGFNFGKVRLNYAEVGNDTDPLRTKDFYSRNPNFGDQTNIYTVNSYKRNPELRPERLKSYEAGVEGAVFNSKLRFDLAFYKTLAQDQIMEVEVSRATGYTYLYVNGGEIENKGIELSLGGTPAEIGPFRWDVNANWTLNRSKVISLAQGLDNFVIQSYQGSVSTNATVGQPFGILKGFDFVYHENGGKIVNADGNYISSASNDQIIGNPNPDWLGGITNTISYKGVGLSFLVDVSKGGDVYSLDMHYGQGTGVTENTAGLNELGNPIRSDPAEGGGILREGVNADGTPNTTRADASYYYGAFYWGDSDFNPSKLTVYDASYVKLREVALSYSLPKSILGNVAQNISISAVGRNLWIIHKNLPYADPESGLGAGNSQGYLSGSYPTTRTLGFKLDLDF